VLLYVIVWFWLLCVEETSSRASVCKAERLLLLACESNTDQRNWIRCAILRCSTSTVICHFVAFCLIAGFLSVHNFPTDVLKCTAGIASVLTSYCMQRPNFLHTLWLSWVDYVGITLAFNDIAVVIGMLMPLWKFTDADNKSTRNFVTILCPCMVNEVCPP